MKIIGIHGRAGSGKDTAADLLCREHGFVKYNLAKPIKDAIDSMLMAAHVEPIDWDDRVQKETVHPLLGVSPRRAAQTLGTEWGRTFLGEDVWLRLAEAFVDYHVMMNMFEECAGVMGVVVPDVRFQNEANWIYGNGGNVIHIVRPGIDNVEAHISEAGIGMGPLDVVIINDGTIEELYVKVINAI